MRRRRAGRRSTDGRFTAVQPAAPPAPATPRLPRPDPARPRQRPHPRLPPGAARADPRRRRHLLDLARADVRRRRAGSTPTPTSRWPGPSTPRWRWPGSPCVGEFHYLHHGPDGTPLRRPERDGPGADRRPRAEAGIRITLLDTCYLAGGLIGDGHLPLDDVAAAVRRRRRRGAGPSGSAALAARRRRPRGSARRSTRCGPCPREQLAVAVARAARRARRCTCTSPSSPPRTTPAAAATACTPTELLADAGVLGPRTTAVHATHLTDDDIALLGGTGTASASARPPSATSPTASARPARCTTPAAPLTLGSDSHAVIDLFEEARARGARRAARHQRARPLHRRPSCSTAATADGHARLGWADAGAHRRRRAAPTWSRSRTRHASAPPGARRRSRSSSPPPPPTSTTSSSTARGRRRDGQPPRSATSARLLRRRDRRASRRPLDEQHAGHRHRRAGHQRRRRSATAARSGIVARRRARRRGRPGRLGRAGRATRRPPTGGSTSAGAAVIPGFVDTHTHLVFAGDRAAEFAARMAGEPYDGGGIRTTVAATRAATDERAARPASAALVAEMRAPGHHDRRDQERLRPDRRRRGARAADRRARSPTRRPSSARTSCPPEYAGDRDGVRRAGHRRRCWTPARRTPAGSTSSASRRRLRRRPGPRGPRPPGRPPGCGRGVHANQLGPGPGVQLAVELGAASVDHCTYLDRRRRRRARRRGDTVATLLPGVEFSTRSPYPDARRLLDAGRHGRAGHRLQPGLLLLVVDAAVIALAVREMGMTPGRGGARGDGRVRRGRCAATDVGVLARGRRADLGGCGARRATSTWPTGRASRWPAR